MLTSLLAQIPQVPSKMKFAGIELSIDDSAKTEIQKTVNKLHANPSYFSRMVDMADLYFPVIEAEFAKTSFPDEIKYLCVQESAFRAEAVSTSNAVGYWQFKEATAIEQGLLVNNQIDERKNIVSSSYAAAKYISAHNASLNNWAYSVIAYNTGLGGVKQFYDTKYAGVNKMDVSIKTHWYFLKHLAHIIAFKDFVGKKTPQLRLQVYTQTLGKSITDFAGQHGMSVSDVAQYNLWISETNYIQGGRDIPVVVPLSYGTTAYPESKKQNNEPAKATVEKSNKKHQTKKEEKLASNSATKISDAKKAEATAVEIKKAPNQNLRYKVNGIPAITSIEGDNPSKLALKGGLEIGKFLKYNEIKNFEELILGQTYFLKSKKSASSILYHTAQFKENLWMISQKYGVKESALRRKNRMSSYETVQPGRVIWLKQLRPSDIPVEYKDVLVPKAKESISYTTPTKIEVEKSKEVAIKEEFQSNENIFKTDTSTNIEKRIPEFTHWVQPNENIDMIAHLYQVNTSELKTWNALSNDSLRVGSVLNIYKSELKINSTKDTPNTNPEEEINIYTQKNQSANVFEAPKLSKNNTIEARGIAQFKTVTVEAGTTLYGLSRQYNVPVEEILKFNPTAANGLMAGTTVQIPIYELGMPQASKKYTVLQGDTYYSISKKIAVSVEQIKLRNNKQDNALKVGEVLLY